MADEVQAMLASFVHQNCVPSTQMQRRISTGLRDSAIRAFLAPTHLAKRMPQAFEGDQRRTFVSSTVAASSKQVRVRTSPHSEIPVPWKGMKRGETENMLMREVG